MTAVDPLAEAGVDEWFIRSVNRLARGRPTDLDAYLVSVGSDVVLDDTKTTCRCHFLALDGNGRPRLKDLAKKLAEQAIDYCIPRSRLAEAAEHLARTGSAEQYARLAAEARALFTQLDKSGEGGELLLYLLLERLLGAPQLLCKMSLKTNSQMHFHGADGVHVRALPGGRLAVYWCESKLYQTPEAATDACFDSIAPFLTDEGGGDSSRDLLLVRDHLDTGDPELDEHLVRYFLDDQPEVLLREVRGASLIGFSLDEYPVPHEDDGKTVQADVAAAVDGWFSRVKGRVSKNKIDSIEIDVFCLPMPSVQAFRDAFSVELGIQ